MMSNEDKEIIAQIVRKELLSVVTDLTVLKYDVEKISKKLENSNISKSEPAELGFDMPFTDSKIVERL